jgi:hypothetical protein
MTRHQMRLDLPRAVRTLQQNKAAKALVGAETCRPHRSRGLMTAIAAQNHSRSTADPSNGSPAAARHLRQAARTLPRNKIASLRARERQDATRAIEVMGATPEPLQRARTARGLRSAMNGMAGQGRAEGSLFPSKTDH